MSYHEKTPIESWDIRERLEKQFRLLTLKEPTIEGLRKPYGAKQKTTISLPAEPELKKAAG